MAPVSEPTSERTLLLIKPDGVERRLVGEILGRVERKGLTIAALELRTVSEKLAKSHYAEHDGKPFFGSLVEFITSSPLVAAIIEGPRAIAAIRQLAGGTDPVEKATPGTIRGDFGLETQYNLVHGSDSPESAEREIALWFGTV
jgi:nucleoside-diphosphate kinase